MSVPTERAVSSTELHSRVESFMERAGKILNHPLATSTAPMSLTATIHPETQRLIRLDFNHDNLPEGSWLQLAVFERPLVFTETDPTSIPILTSEIEREHAALRGMLKPLRQQFVTWKERVLMGARYCDSDVVQDHLITWKPAGEQPTQEGRIISLWTGEANSLPVNVELGDFIGDWFYAQVYFNGCLWHSDNDKVAIWQQASEALKAHICKCAEIRTIGGVSFVRALHQFVVDARADGHQL